MNQETPKITGPHEADSSGRLESAESEYATGRRRFPLAKNWVHAVSGLSGGLEGDMLRKNDRESSEPLADGLGRPVRRYSDDPRAVDRIIR